MKGSGRKARLLIISHGDVRYPKMGYLIRVSNILECLRTISSDYIVLQYPNFLKGPTIREKKDDKRIITLIAPKNWLLLGIKVIIDAVINLRLIRWSDIVLIEGSFFVPYAILAKLLHKYVILDSHSFMKFISRDTKGLLNFIKKRIIGEILDYLAIKISDYIIVVSNVDKDFAIRNYSVKRERVKVIPNVVSIPSINDTTNQGEFWLFVGDLTFEPNYLAVKNILAIAEKLADEKFVIVGRGHEKFTSYPKNVMFAGFVNDIAPYYVKAKGCLIPMFVGSGVKTKVLECLSFGKLTITTPKGVEGLDNIDDVKNCGLIIVNTLIDVIKSIKEAEYFKVNKDCLRDYVRRYNSQEVMCSKLKELFDEILVSK